MEENKTIYSDMNDIDFIEFSAECKIQSTIQVVFKHYELIDIFDPDEMIKELRNRKCIKIVVKKIEEITNLEYNDIRNIDIEYK